MLNEIYKIIHTAFVGIIDLSQVEDANTVSLFFGNI